MFRKSISLMLLMLLTFTVTGCADKPSQNTTTPKKPAVNDINKGKEEKKNQLAPVKREVKLTVKELKQEEHLIFIDAHIPFISGLEDQVAERELNAAWEQRVLVNSDNVRQEAEFEYDSLAQDKQTEHFRPYGYYLRPELKYDGANVISFVQNFDTYMGGAHGMPYREGVNVDLKTGRILTLADWFTPGKDYIAYINKFIQKEIDKDRDDFFEDAFQGIMEDQQYYVEEGYLVIIFQAYDISPFAYGVPEFKIPVKDLEAYGFKTKLLDK